MRIVRICNWCDVGNDASGYGRTGRSLIVKTTREFTDCSVLCIQCGAILYACDSDSCIAN